MQYPPPIDPTTETEHITTFLKTTFQKAGFTTAVIAASGGIDSATSLTLAALALGPQNVHALLLPSRQTAPQHIKDAKQTALNAGLPETNIHTIPITAILQKTWRIISHHEEDGLTAIANKAMQNPQTKLEDRVPSQNQQGWGYTQSGDEGSNRLASINQLRLANLSARIRMLVLYDFARKNHCLVVGTENRSEYHLGYFTRFGDEASDIEPIHHLYKTQVYELAKHLKVPEPILTKAPTAGLWSGQTDESELGFSYQAADPILYLHFDKNLETPAIAKELAIGEDEVVRVLTTCDQNAFKHKVPYHL